MWENKEKHSGNFVILTKIDHKAGLPSIWTDGGLDLENKRKVQNT